MAAEDRQLRRPPGIQAGGHAAHDRRGALHDGRHAPGGHRHRRADRRAAVDAPDGRGAPRPGVGAAALGAGRGLLDRRAGRRADPLHDHRVPPRGARCEDGPGDPDVRRQRRRGPQGRRRLRERDADRPGRRSGRNPCHPDHRARLCHRRRHVRRGAGCPDARQREGDRQGLRRQNRGAALVVQHHPAAGRVRQRHLAQRVVGRQRQRGRLDPDHGRRGAGPGLRAGRDAQLGSVRGTPAGREPVRRKHRMPRPRDRRAPLALPDRAPPDLEHGSAGRAAAGGSDRRRARSQGGGRADEAVDAVHLRPRDR